ncbi:MAG TPA: CopG family transcriptional regulator [bacterium]|jgi:hypothetical protein
MARLTITLSNETHRALKEATARRGETLGQIIEKSLQFYGVKTRESAAQLVARARQASRLGEAEALEVALSETRAARTR